MSSLQTNRSHFEGRPVRYGETGLLALVGELDIDCQEDFGVALDVLVADRPGFIVLDLSEVTFVDSSGLTTLIEAQQRTTADGIEFAVLPSKHAQVNKALRISGVDDFLNLAGNGIARRPFASREPLGGL